jgi:tetratricopeptide (TPR) repeat protein
MKNFIKIGCITVLLFSVSLKVFSQDSIKIKAIRTAFETSYVFEKSSQYLAAINKIKAVYDATSYEINLRLAYLYYESTSYRESAKYYKKAIDLKPSSIEAKLGYALPLYALASWDTLRMQYEAILKLDPNNSTVNYRMGLIYYYKADYATALTYFQKVYEFYPFDYDNTLMYAWTKLKLQKYAEARDLFNIVLLNRPTDSSALEGLKMIK